MKRCFFSYIYTVILLSVISDVAFSSAFESCDGFVGTSESPVEGTKEIGTHKCGPYVQENPNLNDMYPIEGEYIEKFLTGHELVEYLKKRFSLANYIGDDWNKCAVDIEEKDERIEIVLKNEFKSFGSGTVEFQDILLFESDRVSINPDKEYKIRTSKTKKVMHQNDFKKEFKNHIMEVDRIYSPYGDHLFFSITSPNLIGHHIFSFDGFDCYFKAASY